MISSISSSASDSLYFADCMAILKKNYYYGTLLELNPYLEAYFVKFKSNLSKFYNI